VNENGGWRLTDLQRLLVILAVVSSAFLTAMSWGMRSLVPLVVALVLLVAAGVSVFLLTLRARGRGTVAASAYVISAPAPPVGMIVGRADVKLLVELASGESTMVRVRDPAVPVTKWPRVGMIVPVEVTPGNPRQPVRILWDRVEAHRVRPSSQAGPLGPAEEAFAVPFFTEYSGSAAPAQWSGSELDDPAPFIYGLPMDEPNLAASGGERDRATVAVGRAAVPPPHTEITFDGAAGSAGVDAGLDAATAEENARAADYELPLRGMARARQDAGADEQGVGIMLIVSNLERSLRFYADLLHFIVVDATTGSAVLSHGSGRVLLHEVPDMSPVDRRLVHLHVQVPDVEIAYRELKAQGVKFVHQPRVMNRGEKLELSAATFRDPDGHAIALTQWRPT
jgi:resuscitation-promoting factor RpfA